MAEHPSCGPQVRPAEGARRTRPKYQGRQEPSAKRVLFVHSRVNMAGRGYTNSEATDRCPHPRSVVSPDGAPSLQRGRCRVCALSRRRRHVSSVRTVGVYGVTRSHVAWTNETGIAGEVAAETVKHRRGRNRDGRVDASTGRKATAFRQGISGSSTGTVVDQQRSEALHPAEQGDVIDFDATLGEEFLDIAVGESVPEIPMDREEMISGGNRNPLNAELETPWTERQRPDIPSHSHRQPDPPPSNKPCRLLPLSSIGCRSRRQP